ncbi:Maf1 regulator-domain-containing protein [Melampsora americana]|nr:Maf1 regulator-domain-containing protein [Melampsora americana]
MKFLEIPQLELLASSLTHASQSVRVTTRIEAYSCKSVASERKMFKSLDQEFTSDLEVSASISPPEHSHHLLESAFGRLDNKDCRKTFWLLIATLNAAYPDHNFSNVKAEDFHRDESAHPILMKMSEALNINSSSSVFASSLGALSISPDSPAHESTMAPQVGANDIWAGVHPSIKEFLDPAIDLSQCEVYSYYPDPDSDPHAVDSDDFDDTESVSSSIYGVNRSMGARENEEIGETTMWPMDEVDESSCRMASNAPPANISLAPTPTSEHDLRDKPSSSDLGRHACPESSNLASTTSHDPKSPVIGHSAGFSAQERKSRSRSLSMLYGDADLEEESAGGLLWSSHYFFYNRKMKRIVFISIWGRKVLAVSNQNDPAMATLYGSTFDRSAGIFAREGSSPWVATCAVEVNQTPRSHSQDDQTNSENKRRLSIFRANHQDSLSSGSGKSCVGQTMDTDTLAISNVNLPNRPKKKTRRAATELC